MSTPPRAFDSLGEVVIRPSASLRSLLQVQKPKIPCFSLWLWGNEAKKIFFSLLRFLWFFWKPPSFSGSQVTKKMVIFGDEGSMVERFVEIDARVFLEGTLKSVSIVCILCLLGPSSWDGCVGRGTCAPEHAD